MSSLLPNALVFGLAVALFAAIYVARRRGLGFTAATIGALAVGAAVGLAFPEHTAWLKPIGSVYVGVLSAIVAPLIIVSILSSVTSLGSAAKLRGIGLRSVGWLLVTTLIAAVLALGFGLVFGVGRGANLSIEGLDPSGIEGQLVSVTDVIVGFFPSNIVADVAANRIIPIIGFTALIAVSYVLVADKKPALVRPFKALVDALREIVFKAVGFVIELTPYAVLALVADATAGGASRSGIVWSLGALLIVSLLVLALDAFVVNAVLLRVFAQVNPGAFFRKIAPAQLVGFSTQSSAGTLPVTTDVLTRRVGVSPEVAGFTAPLGTTIGMPGCAAIWPILVAVYGVHGLGIDYGAGDYALLVVLGVLVSLGTAGVPGTATITSATVLTAVGLPLELVLLVVPIAAIADTARTATNVTAAAVAATIVARQQGALDDAIFAGAKQFDPNSSAGPDPAADDAPDPAADDAAFVVPVGACHI